MNGISPSSGLAPEKLRHVEDSLANIREALLALRYGSVAITVHEDRIVQIDVTEKKRLNAGK
ncbi:MULTISPECIES: YezD family protein [Sphingopyxis]|uniref:DUF2292 domain-containing protein n=2 Tax=Sphingopyxis TaxID=165697 RepID=A0AAC8Z2A8_SPHMC|nr:MULTISPECIES: YezD family protein [Sphingopyxis]AMU90232.1 hypothetical protein ATM17_14450 [Sphingopyxis macrogoltabida]AMU96639.1 hypothetical protein AOA14_18735 [Sphingopyxis terrae subsp. terrae NBRC 15098]